MILAFDTYYFNESSKTVGIAFSHWNASEVDCMYSETLEGTNAYVSGAFYKRELPCILSLLKQINLTDCDAIIIDGFVYLDDENKKGLGAYLFEHLDQNIPIIGVAKNDFTSITKNKRKVLRGESKKPLFITSIGIDLDTSAELIKNMFGAYRIPDLLKKVDAIGRE